MRHFFFSYARSDLVDPYLDRFYTDLCRELSTRGGLDLASVGFLDREQPNGSSWPTTTGDALADCRVFVPVYSPHYFASHVCGQEWHAFSSRVTAHHRATGIRPDSIVPVWWLPVREPPPVTRHLQDSRDQFGEEYRRFGLRSLVQLRDHESQYLNFLVRYSEMILEAASAPPDPHPVPDLLSLPNAFAPEEQPTPATGRPSAPHTDRGGPRKVAFVVAVGQRDDMLSVANGALDGYGDDLTDWRPYHPASSDSIVVRAQGVASTREMVSSVLPADDSLFDLLDRAAEHKCLVVLIVDPWSVGLATYRELFDRLDRTRSRNSIVLVPSDIDELRKGPHGSHTYNRLYASLGNWMDAGKGSFRGDMPSMGDFERVLGQVLIEIQGRIMHMAEVIRHVNEIGPQYRPVLTGPGGLGR